MLYLMFPTCLLLEGGAGAWDEAGYARRKSSSRYISAQGMWERAANTDLDRRNIKATKVAAAAMYRPEDRLH